MQQTRSKFFNFHCSTFETKEGRRRLMSYLLFVDTKGAFDRIDRKIKWDLMKKYEAEKNQIEKLKDIYEEKS